MERRKQEREAPINCKRTWHGVADEVYRRAQRWSPLCSQVLRHLDPMMLSFVCVSRGRSLSSRHLSSRHFRSRFRISQAVLTLRPTLNIRRWRRNHFEGRLLRGGRAPGRALLRCTRLLRERAGLAEGTGALLERLRLHQPAMGARVVKHMPALQLHDARPWLV
jgi:hypothetical protein